MAKLPKSGKACVKAISVLRKKIKGIEKRQKMLAKTKKVKKKVTKKVKRKVKRKVKKRK